MQGRDPQLSQLQTGHLPLQPHVEPPRRFMTTQRNDKRYVDWGMHMTGHGTKGFNIVFTCSNKPLIYIQFDLHLLLFNQLYKALKRNDKSQFMSVLIVA